MQCIKLLETITSLTGYSYRLSTDNSDNKPYYVEELSDNEMVEIDFFDDLEKALIWFNIRRTTLSVK